MATSKEYLGFILEQLSGVDGITHKQMMGEYILYHHGKIAAYLCDDRLLVKTIPSAMKMLPDAKREPPYEGAKEMLLVSEVDNKDFLTELFNSMYNELPAPKKKDPIKIKKLTKKHTDDALTLCLDVFLQFEAPDYTEEGVEEFRNTLGNADFVKNLRLYGAFENDELAGVLATRDTNHISLFFVKAEYQRRGIGKRLFLHMLKDCDCKEFTVNSSPYAVEIYRHLGFNETDTEQTTNGIRYTPMKYSP